MENNISNLKDILSNKKLKISIPIIQRDYAQGRKDVASIRGKFLDEIFNRLDNDEKLFLDFVINLYRSTDSNASLLFFCCTCTLQKKKEKIVSI